MKPKIFELRRDDQRTQELLIFVSRPPVRPEEQTALFRRPSQHCSVAKASELSGTCRPLRDLAMPAGTVRRFSVRLTSARVSPKSSPRRSSSSKGSATRLFGLDLRDIEIGVVGNELHEWVLRIAWQRKTMTRLPKCNAHLWRRVERPLPREISFLARLHGRLLKGDLLSALRSQLARGPGLRLSGVYRVFIVHHWGALVMNSAFIGR